MRIWVYGAAQNWVGTIAPNFGDLRGPGRFNLDMTLRRSLKIRERFALEVSAEAANVLNSSQMSGTYSGALGSTTVTPNVSIGTKPGMGSSDTFGTICGRTCRSAPPALLGREACGLDFALLGTYPVKRDVRVGRREPKAHRTARHHSRGS